MLFTRPNLAAKTLVALLMAAGAATSAHAAYTVDVLVANDAKYNPSVMVDPLLQNGWGIAIRPPGAGGHFWVSNFATGTTTTYVGDANGVPLYQDSLKSVAIGKGAGVRPDGRRTADTPMPTGQVYNSSSTDFVVAGEGISAAAKFLFVTAEGTISGWTEVADPLPGDPNHKRRQTTSIVKVDQSQSYDDDRLRYTGVAVTDFAANNKLYVTNYAADCVEVYDKNFAPVTIAANAFRLPNQLAGEHAWNVQYMKSGPGGEGRLWVAFAQGDDPWEQIAAPGAGAIAEFDLEGNFICKVTQSVDLNGLADGELSAPWGMAIAPSDFGPLSNALLVANFGDGTIAGFDLQTGLFIDYLRDAAGDKIVVDGIWGLTFGNGVALGDANALYFTAGPNSEQDGLFGSIRVTPIPEPAGAALLTLGAAGLTRRPRRRA